jgi:hypothetical protein
MHSTPERKISTRCLPNTEATDHDSGTLESTPKTPIRQQQIHFATPTKTPHFSREADREFMSGSEGVCAYLEQHVPGEVPQQGVTAHVTSL